MAEKTALEQLYINITILAKKHGKNNSEMSKIMGYDDPERYTQKLHKLKNKHNEEAFTIGDIGRLANCFDVNLNYFGNNVKFLAYSKAQRVRNSR